MIEVKSPIRHNGRLYREGEIIADITPEQAAVLVAAGSADWERVKPTKTAEQIVSQPDPRSKDDSGVDWEEAVKSYHKGFGNYEIPGVGTIKGKEAAIKALQEAQTKR